MKLSLIIACDENNLIGYKNKLPWYIPEDLKRFKKITLGHPIIMGRNTFESIGKVLPGRENIVVTGNAEYKPEGVTVLHSVKEVTTYIKNEEAFVIGGATLMKAMLPYITKIYLTKIHHTFKGDIYLPDLNLKKWKIEHSEEYKKTDSNPYPYSFHILTKKY